MHVFIVGTVVRQPMHQPGVAVSQGTLNDRGTLNPPAVGSGGIERCPQFEVHRRL